MDVERFDNLRKLIRSSRRHYYSLYPFLTNEGAAYRGTRASSSGEQGVIGLARTGAGFRSPFAHAARLEQEAAPTDDSLFVVPQSSRSRLTAGYTTRCVTCGLVFGAGELRGHQVREHRDHVYRCSCRKPFRSSQDLRRHSRDAGHAISTVYRLPGEERNSGPRITDQRIKDQGSRIKGSRIKDQRIMDQGSRIKGSWIKDQGSRIMDQGSRIKD